MRFLIIALLCLFIISCTKRQALWSTFLAGQVVSAGHINYQQEQGYYEAVPIYHVFGDRHPSKEQVYLVKGFETAAVYLVTKTFPKYENGILRFCIGVQVGFFVTDTCRGINFEMRF